MSFLGTLSKRLGFTAEEADERSAGLEEDELQDEEEDEEDEEDSGFSFRFPLKDRFSKGRKQSAGVRNQRTYSEDEEEEEEEPQQGYRTARRGNVIHDSRMDPRGAQEPQYTHCERIYNVRQIEECREIIKYLLRGESVLLNLENIDPKDCGRVVDLLSGAAFALQGRMLKVAHLSYLLAPESVEVIEEDAYAQGRMRYR